MKVLLVNGSPHPNGCTARALQEVEKTLQEEGVETKLIQIGTKDIRGCIACGTCEKTKKCVFDDIVNETRADFEEADGIVVGSPVYYGAPNGTLLNYLTRMFYSNSQDLRMKVGAAVVSCRRSGATVSFDVLNKYFTIANMPVAAGSYWNNVHGFSAEDVEKDLEGLQNMRNVARNMAFLMRAIQAEKKNGEVFVEKEHFFTSFPDGK